MKNEKLKSIIKVLWFTFMISSIIIFSFLYDFNKVKEFIYSNF
ncbi:hypothetical protein HMPREF3188_00854 [Tissierellia bacterium KA00581]|nr:hypothetical protein HMPREF3188_00854 [Tissierellia bacterium KA00581]